MEKQNTSLWAQRILEGWRNCATPQRRSVRFGQFLFIWSHAQQIMLQDCQWHGAGRGGRGAETCTLYVKTQQRLRDKGSTFSGRGCQAAKQWASRALLPAFLAGQCRCQCHMSPATHKKDDVASGTRPQPHPKCWAHIISTATATLLAPGVASGAAGVPPTQHSGRETTCYHTTPPLIALLKAFTARCHSQSQRQHVRGQR